MLKASYLCRCACSLKESYQRACPKSILMPSKPTGSLPGQLNALNEKENCSGGWISFMLQWSLEITSGEFQEIYFCIDCIIMTLNEADLFGILGLMLAFLWLIIWYVGTVHCRQEGVAGLWKGIGPNVARNAIVNAAELASFDQVCLSLCISSVLSASHTSCFDILVLLSVHG